MANSVNVGGWSVPRVTTYSAHNIGCMNINGEQCPVQSISYEMTYAGTDYNTVIADIQVMIPSGKSIEFKDAYINSEEDMLKNFIAYKGLTMEEYQKFKTTFTKLEKL